MNIQRNIFAGLLIFLIFLTIPMYLNFIGLDDSDINKEEVNTRVLDSNSQTKSNNEQIENRAIYQESAPLASKLDNSIEKMITVNTDYYQMILSNRSGGSILLYELTEKKNNQLSKYIGSYDENQNYSDSLNVALINNMVLKNNQPPPCSPCLSINGEKIQTTFSLDVLDDSIYLEQGDNQTLVYSYSWGKDEYIKKIITLNGDGYDFESTLEYKLNSNSVDVEIIWDSGILPTEMGDADVYEGHSSVYIWQDNGLESITQNSEANISAETFASQTDWFAIRNKYFAIAVIPENPADYATLSSHNNVFQNREITPIYTAILGKKLNNRTNYSFTTYLGPLDIEHVSLLGANIESIMNFGWSIIKPFSKFILWLIKTIHHSLGINYGFVLILIAFIMRIVMGPLTKKSAEASSKMQAVAPLQKKIQEKYKDNPQQLQKEMGELWKKNGVNPISGCLPMLLQWPVLMSFFIVFRSTIEFRGEPFVFWINDLSQPDYIFSLPFSIPLYGSAVAVLPIIMGISMFLTMSTTMQDKSQKPLMYFMNGFFILMFNSFPSGLTLYYTIFNFLSYQQQLSIKKNK